MDDQLARNVCRARIALRRNTELARAVDQNTDFILRRFNGEGEQFHMLRLRDGDNRTKWRGIRVYPAGASRGVWGTGGWISGLWWRLQRFRRDARLPSTATQNDISAALDQHILKVQPGKNADLAAAVRERVDGVIDGRVLAKAVHLVADCVGTAAAALAFPG